MLIVPTDPNFLDTMVRFVTTFVPTLTIHRVHIGERTDELLSLQIEMEDGSIMFVEAQYWNDRIELTLEYGWQRLDVWMYANFPTHGTSTPPNLSLPSCDLGSESLSYPEKKLDLEIDCLNQISMNRVCSKHIDEDLFKLRRESRLIDSPFSDLLSHRYLSRVQRETVFRSIHADMVEEIGFVFDGNVGKDGALKQCEFPKSCSRFEHSILRPSTVNGKLEESF